MSERISTVSTSESTHYSQKDMRYKSGKIVGRHIGVAAAHLPMDEHEVAGKKVMSVLQLNLSEGLGSVKQ